MFLQYNPGISDLQAPCLFAVRQRIHVRLSFHVRKKKTSCSVRNRAQVVIRTVFLASSLGKMLTKHRKTEFVSHEFRGGKSVKDALSLKTVTFCILFAQKKHHPRLHFHASPLFF